MRSVFLFMLLIAAFPQELKALENLEKLQKGNEYVFSSVNAITNKPFPNTNITVNEVTPSEYLIRWGDGLHVYNNLLRSIKRGAWTYSPFGCDGLPKELKEGYTETFKYSGTWAKDGDKSEAVGTCIIRVGAEKDFVINNQRYKAIQVENIRSYYFKRNPSVKRLYIQDAYFAKDLGVWVEGDWIEKHDNKTFSHTKFKLERFSLR